LHCCEERKLRSNNSSTVLQEIIIANRPASRSNTDWLLLAGFCGFLFFFGLGYFGLLGADEPRYAQVAREMLDRHDWITPTLGGQPWLEKPIFYYWQAIIAYKLFGVSDWAARLPSAVDATLMVVAVFLFLRRFRPGFHLDGALITASAAGIIGFARAASMDMPLASTFSIAMLAWYAWHESGRKLYLGVFYVFVAMGTLAKGPIAPFLAGAIVITFAVAKKSPAFAFKTLWVPGILFFLLVAAPWYIAVQLRNPDFFRVFILEHNFSRFGTNRYHHPQPVWFYLPIVTIALLPWAVFASAALFEAVRTWWVKKQTQDVFNIFLAIWFLLPLLFFSISKSKLPGYILPAVPAGTLLLAEYVHRRGQSNENPDALLIVLHSLAAAFLLLPALLLQILVVQHRLTWGLSTLLAIALTAVLALAIGATLHLRPGLRLLRFVTLVPVVLAIAAVLRLDTHFLNGRFSTRLLSDSVTRIDNRSLPIAVYQVSREIEYGLHFYRNQRIARYESGEIPSEEHILIAPHSIALERINEKLPGRRVSYLGSDQPQGLDYFWISAPGMSMGQMKM
jgi:4-amino-4-deoxy-L-arabinose transferase-like glycosyltransferase